ncbi:bestrophin family protein [Chitinophagaceae bacterium MMS25-I14]
MLLKNGIPLGYVFGKIKYEILFVALYGGFIALLGAYFPALRVSIPIAVPAVLGTVISLLLGFRSNQAYDRWWEARHIWGAIVNDSRTLGRQLLTFVQSNYDNDRAKAVIERMIRRQSGWAYSLGQHLRGQNASKGLEKYIGYEEYEFAQHYTVIPVALLELQAKDISLLLDEGWINTYQQVELDRTLSRLCESMGKCERIKNTVFPSTYSLYIHFSLLLFIGLLPFSLVEHFGHAGIPVMIAIAASFLLIEKMAIHLQDPFENKPTDTPMTAIARNIERDLFQMLRERPVTEHIAAATFYVL